MDIPLNTLYLFEQKDREKEVREAKKRALKGGKNKRGREKSERGGKKHVDVGTKLRKQVGVGGRGVEGREGEGKGGVSRGGEIKG